LEIGEGLKQNEVKVTLLLLVVVLFNIGHLFGFNPTNNHIIHSNLNGKKEGGAMSKGTSFLYYQFTPTRIGNRS